jgi:hypothetical protein
LKAVDAFDDSRNVVELGDNRSVIMVALAVASHGRLRV